jgi:hypothetical protein
MVADKKTPEKDEGKSSIELLRKLREKLFSEQISTARLAAQHLGWLQDDGLTILKEALFGEYSKIVKKAAAYGLRSMRGRMKRAATDVLQQGLIHRDRFTQEACIKSLQLMRGEIPPKRSGASKPKSSRMKIKDLPNGNLKTSSPAEKNTQFGYRRPQTPFGNGKKRFE